MYHYNMTILPEIVLTLISYEPHRVSVFAKKNKKRLLQGVLVGLDHHVFETCHQKTEFLPMRKQRRRSASQ